MKKFIENTGLSFSPGQSLKTSDLNTMNNTINKLVNSVNNLMSGLFDYNVETDNYEPTSLTEAIHKTTRRALGMKIRFLGFNSVYEEYSFLGQSVDDDDWFNENNWTSGPHDIDGGLW